MRPGQGLLDTSVVILLDRLDARSDLPEEPLITAVTLAELSVGPLVTDDESERAARQARLQVTESSFDPLPFDASAARSFGRVAAELRRSGRTARARSFDAMIAATALSRGLSIFTANPEDFNGIDGLEVVAITQP
jgi:predicted nucleic acid-binding protein